MTRVLFPEWRDEAGASRFPFEDGCSLRAASGLVLADDWILDASISLIGGSSGTYLSKVSVGPDTVTLSVGDASSPDRASGSFDPSFRVDSVPLFDRFGRSCGLLVCNAEAAAALQAWPQGEHRFLPSAASFAAGVCHPVPEGVVSGILLDDGEVFAGDAYLVGERGVVLRYEGGAVRVDVVGDPLFKRAQCGEAAEFSTPRFIKTINGVPMGPDGSFQLSVGGLLAPASVLRIFPDGGVLRIETVGQPTGERLP